jgi:hypothetical protein
VPQDFNPHKTIQRLLERLVPVESLFHSSVLET